MPILFLSILTVVSATLTISAEYRGPRRNVYLFKPLTIVLITAIAVIPKYPVSPIYRYLIVAGLVCSLVGDIFLALPSNRFIHGLTSFLVAHVFYIAAFAYAGSDAISKWAAIPLLLHGGLMLMWLWPSLGKLKVPVIVYMAALLLMALMATSWYLQSKLDGGYLASVGAILFVVSDSILAVNKFKGTFRSAQLLILITYFAAQLLIALST